MVKKYVRYGASPRGAQALILGAKITALLAGRFNVAYEDIRQVAPAALRHRLLLSIEGLAEGVSPDQIIQELLQTVLEINRGQPGELLRRSACCSGIFLSGTKQ